MVENSVYPQWGETFHILVCHNANSLRVSVIDKDIISFNDKIGWAEFNCEGLIDGEEIDDWFDLMVGEGGDVQGSVHITVRLIPKGAVAGETTKIVSSYFPLRENNRVTLYQVLMLIDRNGKLDKNG